MKALSILQPWAWLIVTAQKDIENRSWQTKQRGRIWLHAGKKYTREDHHGYEHIISHHYGIVLPSFEILKAETGGLVGSVEIVDCVRQHKSAWKDPDSYGFVLARPEPSQLIPYRGQLGFFEIPIEIALNQNAARAAATPELDL